MSSERKSMGRREFLRLSVLSAGAAAVAACTPAPPVSPTKPAADAPAAAPPTKAAVSPVSAATAAPAATQPPEASLGARLIGKLEGPEVVTDPAKMPTKFKEAPMLAELVKAGKLPPVEKRLPEEPLVLKPVHEVGKYGGTWRRGFTGPADAENGARICASEKLLFSDFRGVQTMPSVAKGWKSSDGDRTFTLYLRKGMKWSDGEPFTADDILFWYQDIYSNKEIIPTPTEYMSINGKQGTIEKVDDYTVAYKFPEPYPMFEEVLRGDTPIGRGFVTGGRSGFWGGYAPAHYFKQFLPKYVSKEELDQKAKDAKFPNWLGLLKFKFDWTLNPELPVLTPWKTVSPANTPNWTLERNPYFYEVDTDGNQLPYMDKILMTMAENLEVLNLRAVAGEYDFQERHTDVAKIPVYVENQKRSNFTVRLDPPEYGSDSLLLVNLSYDADPEVAKWLATTDFRRAISMGIEREQINEAFFLGLGVCGSPVVTESHPYNPGPEYRTLWSTFDKAKANAMLDKLGLDKKDSDGYRLRTDGKGPLRLQIITRAAMFVNFAGIAEMVKEQWRKNIGIAVDIHEVERSLYETRLTTNELQLILTMNTGSEVLYTYPINILPVDMVNPLNGPLYAKWFNSGGKEGKAPTGQLLKAMELFRSAPGLSYEDRVKTAQEIWRIVVDEQWGIGIVGQGGGFNSVRIVKNNIGNSPERISQIRDTRTPGGAHCEMLYFKS